MKNKEPKFLKNILKKKTQMKAEEKIRQWIIDNGNHTPCTREDSKFGCLMCQELYQALDEYAIEFAVFHENRISNKKN